MSTQVDEIVLLDNFQRAFERNLTIPEKEDFKRRVEELKRLLTRVNFSLMASGYSISEIPKNIPELIKFLETKTIEELFPDLSDDLEDIKEENILNIDDYTLTDEFNELIEGENYEERLQKQIMKIRSLIEENGLKNEQYERCRLFFTPERTILEESELNTELILAGIDSSLIQEMKKRFYSKTRYSGEMKICPICGKRWTEEHFEKNSLCKELSEELNKKTPLIKKFKASDVLFELNSGTIKYTLIPNIGEILLKARLEKLLKGLGVPFKITMYPELDKYDLILEINGKEFIIDVKDYRRPKKLAQHFNERVDAMWKLANPDNPENVEGVFIVVMDYRVNIYGKSYISELRKFIKRNDVKKQFISESELFEKIKDFIKKGE